MINYYEINFYNFCIENFTGNNKIELFFTDINKENFNLVKNFLFPYPHEEGNTISSYKIVKQVKSDDFDIEINEKIKIDEYIGKKIIYRIDGFIITLIEKDSFFKISFSPENFTNFDFILECYKIYKGTKNIYPNYLIQELNVSSIKLSEYKELKDITYVKFFEGSSFFSVYEYNKNRLVLAIVKSGIWLYDINKTSYNFLFPASESNADFFEYNSDLFFEVILKDSDIIILDCIKYKRIQPAEYYYNLYSRLQIFNDLKITFRNIKITCANYKVISNPSEYFQYLDEYKAKGIDKVILVPSNSKTDNVYTMELNDSTLDLNNFLTDKYKNHVISKFTSLDKLVEYDEFSKNTSKYSYKNAVILYNIKDYSEVKMLKKLSQHFFIQVFYTTNSDYLNDYPLKYNHKKISRDNDEFLLNKINITKYEDNEDITKYNYHGNNINVISVAGDGSCMIHSLLKASCSLYQNFNSKELRLNLVKLFRTGMINELEREVEYKGIITKYYNVYSNEFFSTLQFENFENGIDKEIKNFSQNSLIKRLANHRNYLGEEVLLLCSEMIKMNILVLTKINLNAGLKFTNYINLHNFDKSIILIYDDNEHYECGSINSQTIFNNSEIDNLIRN
jgi:hypothetical protein